MRRHRLAERLLVDVIGLEWEKVHREADRWEHAISADVEAKLVLLLGDPATCPHGNPIPGSIHKVEGGVSTPLSQSAPGPVVVRRISEKIEIDDGALVFLAEAKLIPGSSASWSRAAPTECASRAIPANSSFRRTSPNSCGSCLLNSLVRCGRDTWLAVGSLAGEQLDSLRSPRRRVCIGRSLAAAWCPRYSLRSSLPRPNLLTPGRCAPGANWRQQSGLYALC